VSGDHSGTLLEIHTAILLSLHLCHPDVILTLFIYSIFSYVSVINYSVCRFQSHFANEFIVVKLHLTFIDCRRRRARGGGRINRRGGGQEGGRTKKKWEPGW